jgi:hypothetical protein
MDARDGGWAAAAAGGAPGDTRATAAAAHRGGSGGIGAAAAPSSPRHALFAPMRDVPGMFAQAAAADDDTAAAADVATDAHRGSGGTASAMAHFPAPPELQPLAPLATDVFMHDAAASPPPEPPEALLGRRVRCVFDNAPVEGVVVSVHRTAAYGTL